MFHQAPSSAARRSGRGHVPPEVAVGAEEGGGRGAAEDGPGGTAVGAERGAGVAGADPVGAVHEAVARQAEPGGIGAAVDLRRRGSAVIAGRRLRAGVTAVRPSSRSYEEK